MRNALMPPERRGFFAFSLLAVLAVFFPTIIELFRFAWTRDLYSHILLIPFVSIYIGWQDRLDFPPVSEPNRMLGSLVLAASCAIFLVYWFAVRTTDLSIDDHLAWQTLSLVCCLAAVCLMHFGRATVMALAFPLGLLLFMVPWPVVLVNLIESFFQHTSAVAAALLFKIVGTPFFRDQTYFQLPGINLQVAPECSGIRSSLALFITSIVAGKLFLRSPYLRILFAMAVIPLGIVRNGVRIFTIGELCVHVGPDMIDSPIHHHGGPLFFGISLIPFGILLFFLAKLETKKSTRDITPPQTIALAR